MLKFLYSVALLCVTFKTIKQGPKFFGRPKNFLSFFWDMTPCTMAKNNFVCNFLPHSLFTLSTLKMGTADFPKHRQIYTILHGLTSKKTVFFIVTTYRTSNLTVCSLVYRHIGDHLRTLKYLMFEDLCSSFLLNVSIYLPK